MYVRLMIPVPEGIQMNAKTGRAFFLRPEIVGNPWFLFGSEEVQLFTSRDSLGTAVRSQLEINIADVAFHRW